MTMARQQGTDAGLAALAQANRLHPNWEREASWAIVYLATRGRPFIVEWVFERIGLRTPDGIDKRAIGPIVNRIARNGYIERMDETAPADTSHGSQKPLWRLVAGQGRAAVESVRGMRPLYLDKLFAKDQQQSSL